MQNQEHNPLSNFYRAVKYVVRLPSEGRFYEEGKVININDDSEVHILPMTAQDEVLLKNPDALLNGDAIVGLIRSCVPAVVEPRKLLCCDLDALMIGIRAASYGEDNEMTATCPNCEKENTFTISYDTLLEVVEPLEEYYEAVLESGVSVYIVPAKFDATIKQQKAYFEGTKIQRILKDDKISDENRLALFAKALNNASKFNFELVSDSVLKVRVSDGAGGYQEVTNKKHIDEFLKNISVTDAKIIDTHIDIANSHGIKKDLDAVCSHCGHEWQIPIDYNDSNFS